MRSRTTGAKVLLLLNYQVITFTVNFTTTVLFFTKNKKIIKQTTPSLFLGKLTRPVGDNLDLSKLNRQLLIILIRKSSKTFKESEDLVLCSGMDGSLTSDSPNIGWSYRLGSPGQRHWQGASCCPYPLS